jgi:hypothetical protein
LNTVAFGIVGFVRAHLGRRLLIWRVGRIEARAVPGVAPDRVESR